MEASAETGGLRMEWRDVAAIALLSMGTSWGAGNVGPVVPDLEGDFDLSLGSIGVLSGTIFYVGVLIGLAVAPKIAERASVVTGMRAACLFAGAGSLLFALGPGFGTLAAGRVAAGIGLGLGAALGPVFGRAVGGVKGVGVFGAAFQFGIGGGLATGSIVNDAGIDWRVTFVVSALVGFSALVFLRSVDIDFELSGGGFFRSARRSPSVYRLALLFIAMFGAPLTLGAWLVHYLTVQGDMALAVAGALSFVLFGASALLRLVGATLASRGFPAWILAGLAPALATAGILAICFDRSFSVALPAVVLMAAGFAIPYAVMIVAAERLYPKEPADPVALMTAAGSAVPIAIIPLVGVALSGGWGEAAFAGIAIFVAIAGLMNARLPDRAIPGGELPEPA
jgi:DHA1 family inner membrane transport protein